MDAARLRQLRDTAWTEAGYLYWKQGDPLDRKREVWAIHVETGLDPTARGIIEAFGAPEAIAIRRTQETNDARR